MLATLQTHSARGGQPAPTAVSAPRSWHRSNLVLPAWSRRALRANACYMENLHVMHNGHLLPWAAPAGAMCANCNHFTSPLSSQNLKYAYSQSS